MVSPRSRRSGSLVILGLLWIGVCPSVAAGRGGQLELRVVDQQTSQPIPCRMHLRTAAGKVVKPPKVPFWHDHFCFDGTILLKLPLGNYNFEIERGLEYLTVRGHFTINEFAEDTKTVELKRFVDMAHEGWYSGDLECERPLKDIELLMRAEELHLTELVNWGQGKPVPAKPQPVVRPLTPFAENYAYQSLAGLFARANGSFLILNRAAPPAADAIRDGTLAALLEGKSDSGPLWFDVRRAASWDLPIWIAQGRVDSIELASSELGRATTKADEAGMRPRDPLLFAGSSGIGRWTETIYYHLLNCGLRIPPTAASGSGAAPNPLGYNRVYAQLDGPFGYENWFAALKAGRVVVTNGPLIRPTVEGEMPGHVFQADAGQEVELEVGLSLATRDKVSYLELVQNGRSVQEVRLDQWAKANGKLPKLKFDRSGWFVIRAVTDVSNTHRFASTAPYYVEIGYERRISRASVQFFLDWLEERAKKIKPPHDPAEAQKAAEANEQAKEFWQNLLSKANAD